MFLRHSYHRAWTNLKMQLYPQPLESIFCAQGDRKKAVANTESHLYLHTLMFLGFFYFVWHDFFYSLSKNGLWVWLAKRNKQAGLAETLKSQWTHSQIWVVSVSIVKKNNSLSFVSVLFSHHITSTRMHFHKTMAVRSLYSSWIRMGLEDPWNMDAIA